MVTRLVSISVGEGGRETFFLDEKMLLSKASYGVEDGEMTCLCIVTEGEEFLETLVVGDT